MKLNYSIAAAAVLAAVVLIGLVLWIAQRNEAERPVVYETAEAALEAGIAGNLSDTETPEAPVFSYQDGDNTYYVLPFVIRESGALAYAEAIFVLRVYPSGTGYCCESSYAYAVYQEDEDGNIVNSHGEVSYTDTGRNVTILMGHSGEDRVIPDETNLLAANLKDGIADNDWGMFVLVYRTAQEGPLPPEFELAEAQDEAAA